jgi:hypothetical protein
MASLSRRFRTLAEWWNVGFQSNMLPNRRIDTAIRRPQPIVHVPSGHQSQKPATSRRSVLIESSNELREPWRRREWDAGWPNSPEPETLRAAWLEATDIGAEKRIAEHMQLQMWRDVP